jgi:predicted nucleic acid-binding protein
MVIVDTTVWIDYFRCVDNPETNWLDKNLSLKRLGLTDLILCEVLQGIRDHDEFAQARAELLKLRVFSTGGIELAIIAAQNYRELRLRGYTVLKTIDCLIATFCLQGGHELLHRDRDYDSFQEFLGLRVLRPK